MSEENQGFTVSDKRKKWEEPQDLSNKENASPASPPPAGDSEKRESTHIPPDFSGFILSLGTSALVHLGERVLPDQPSAPVNFPQAQEIIDLLSLLEEKTKGNLTREESGLLSNLLYTLRMKFVEIRNK